MSDVVIFDTSVLIDNLRSGRHGQRMASATGLIRTSSVVLAELWRGATTRSERRIVEALERTHPVLTPTHNNWIESGRLLGKIRAAHGLSAHQLRDLHFDVLIALTARSHGARLITSNRRGFELIHRYRKFELEVWS
ncbi:MAG: type II toxin-antitoxin system VapC family toxin [Terriglobales bacterium]|jgi:predicted nucleic acid-binding protein